MRRRLIFATLLVLFGAYVTPGETIVQIGLRKIAFEQGVKAASQSWDFEAAPRVEMTPEVRPARKVARR